jgi:protein-S-isoprenylcysteine O-methyltransferase Ste14
MKILRNQWSSNQMSQRRIRKRQTALPTLPYWRFILASFLLVLSILFLFEFFTDPRSGQLRPARMMTPVFVLFLLVEAGMFYTEFRLRKRRQTAAPRTPRRVAMKGEGAHAS